MPALNVGSLFSGIGGIDLGLERAGMRVLWQCEANPYRREVLRSHWPDGPCAHRVEDIGADTFPLPTGVEQSERIDLLCGGFPCQDLSVAGRRAGLAGARSSLFFEFARIADALRPTWLLVENVPGLLSSNGGRDFAVVYTTLAELGYGLAWRILDSRYFGVPQRRRRVFVVGHLGARSAEPFLPFLEGGGGDSEASGEAGATPTGAPENSAGASHYYVEDFEDGTLTSSTGRIDRHPLIPTHAHALTTSMQRLGDTSEETFIAAPLSHGSNPNSNAAGRRREDDENLVAYGLNTNRGGNADMCLEEEGSPPITASHGNPGGVMLGSAVRRLTPTECCRLQGFPDDWLGTPNEKPDSPRYAALGDAVTVPVAEWIGRRILEAHVTVTV